MIATLESVASCADSSSELRPPFQQAVACRVFPKETISLYPEAIFGREAVVLETATGKSTSAATGTWLSASHGCASPWPAQKLESGGPVQSLDDAIPELALMANVLNPEPESITLNTELETPTLEPATELETLESLDQQSRESTSNPETAEAVELPELDADTQLTKSDEPVAEEAHESAPEAEAAATPVSTCGSGRADGRFFRRPRGL